MKIDPATPLREIALAVPGATALLDGFGLDYCCGGSTPLATACRQAGLLLEQVLAAIDDVSTSAPNVATYHDWRAEPPGAVAAHIVEQNYPAERVSMSDTAALAAQAASVHGAQHPELRVVDALWTELCDRLRQHLHEEGPTLEPVQRGASADSTGEMRIRAIVDQHEEVLGLMKRIRALTHDYAPPDRDCDALVALYRNLEAFEADLHEHVHLSDNVLFAH